MPDDFGGEIVNFSVTHALVEAVIGIAAAAGDRIMEVYETDFAVQRKDDKSPLTEADLAAHDTIIAGLERLEPRLPVISEESAHTPYSERSCWGEYWLVDPLDGTREFVKRNGEFTVNIALISEQRPVLGVIFVPVTGVCYSAGKGLGARKREPGKASRRIHVRGLPTGRITVAGSRSHSNAQSEAFIRNLGDIDLISIGSSLKSCLIAEGAADIYPRFGPTSEWDTAAAQCIVEEAGGHLTDASLQPLRYNAKASLTNPPFLVFGDASEDWRKYVSPDTH